METIVGFIGIICAIIAIGLPIRFLIKLTNPILPNVKLFLDGAVTILLSLAFALVVFWCEYYTTVVWVNNKDWSALQDVSATMAYFLLGFFVIVMALNIGILKKLKSSDKTLKLLHKL